MISEKHELPEWETTPANLVQTEADASSTERIYWPIGRTLDGSLAVTQVAYKADPITRYNTGMAPTNTTTVTMPTIDPLRMRRTTTLHHWIDSSDDETFIQMYSAVGEIVAESFGDVTPEVLNAVAAERFAALSSEE